MRYDIYIYVIRRLKVKEMPGWVASGTPYVKFAWKAGIVQTAPLANPKIYVKKMVPCLTAILGTFIGQASGK